MLAKQLEGVELTLQGETVTLSFDPAVLQQMLGATVVEGEIDSVDGDVDGEVVKPEPGKPEPAKGDRAKPDDGL